MGALKENYCLTMSFAVMLAVIFILMIAGGIAAYVLRNEIEDEVTKILLDTQKKYNDTDSAGVTQTWDKLQREFTCCGVKNYDEWKTRNLTTVYPQSCCKDEASSTCPADKPIAA